MNDNDHSSREKKENFPYYEHFSDLELDTWKHALEKYVKSIKPLQLALHLEDRWRDRSSGWDELRDPDKEELIRNARGIIDLILGTYENSGSRENIDHYLAGIREELQHTDRKHKEQQYRQKIHSLLKEKSWFELFDYIEQIQADDYSQEFSHFLAECQKQADQGREWLRKKDRLTRLIEEQPISSPGDLVKVCRKKIEDIEYLKTYCRTFGQDIDREELNTLYRNYYTRIINAIKDRRESFTAKDALKQLNEIELISGDMFPDLPGEWLAYKEQLANESKDFIQDSINKRVKEALEKAEPGKLEEEVEQLRSTVPRDELDIPGIDAHVKSLIDSLTRLGENDTILDTMYRVEEIENIKNYLNQVYDIGRNIETMKTRCGDIVCKGDLFRELEDKYNKTRDIIAKTLEISEKINDLLQLLEEESKKILQGRELRVSLNIKKFQDKIRTVERELSGLLKLKIDIKLLANLKEKVKRLKQAIFVAPAGGQIRQDADALGEVAEKVKNGDLFYEKIEELNQADHNDPLELMEQLLDIINENRSKRFIFRHSISRVVLDYVEKTVSRISRKIDENLSAMEESVTRFYPLPAPRELEEADRFRGRLLAIVEKRASLSRDFYDLQKLVEARGERLDRINALVRVMQSIHSEKYAAARDISESADSFDQKLQNQLQAVIYFYEHLHKRPWDETHWLYFFDHHCPGLVDEDSKTPREAEYSRMFQEYETLFETECFKLSPPGMGKHVEIFRRYLKNSRLFPYIMLIHGEYNTGQLLDYIQNNEPARNLYNAFLDYLARFRMWQVYVALFRAAAGDLKETFGESPLDMVHEDLEDRCHLIEERFCSGSIDPQEIEILGHCIPHDRDFNFYLKKFDLLKALFKNYQYIQGHLNRYKQENTWKIPGLPAELENLKHLSGGFSGKFARIPTDNRWEETFRLLTRLFDAGTGILNRLAVVPGGSAITLDDLEGFKDKAGIVYSDTLKGFLKELPDLWKNFIECSGKLARDGWKAREIFNREFFGPLMQKWEQTEFCALWTRENLPVPESVDDFFHMFETVLANHREFLKLLQTHTVSQNHEKFKVLDPFIRANVDSQMTVK